MRKSDAVKKDAKSTTFIFGTILFHSGERAWAKHPRGSAAERTLACPRSQAETRRVAVIMMEVFVAVGRHRRGAVTHLQTAALAPRPLP